MILLNADTVTFAVPVTGNTVALIKEPFTPSPDLVFGDLVEADFDAYGRIEAVPGSQQFSTDPANGDALLQLVPPVGGWRWETGSDFSFPQTIYGFVICKSGGDDLFASELLPTPITLTTAEQALVLPVVQLRLRNGSIT